MHTEGQPSQFGYTQKLSRCAQVRTEPALEPRAAQAADVAMLPLVPRVGRTPHLRATREGSQVCKRGLPGSPPCHLSPKLAARFQEPCLAHCVSSDYYPLRGPFLLCLSCFLLKLVLATRTSNKPLTSTELPREEQNTPSSVSF